ncbi:MAG: hypothetical protein U1F43_34960 [Myxococcota bacterium]
MGKPTEDFLTLPGIAEPLKPLLRKLLAEELIPVPALRALVDTYIRVIREASRNGAHVNLVVGEGIALALLSVLARVDARTTPDERRIIQSAVRYFVIENDAMGHDLAHEDGLFDDARVVNAMLRWIGRDDLQVAVPASGAARRPTSMGSAASSR